MDGIEVIDNFLEEESFNELQKFFISPRSQWRFVDFVVSKNQDNQKKDGYFVHDENFYGTESPNYIIVNANSKIKKTKFLCNKI